MGSGLRLALNATTSGDLSALYTAAGSVMVALIGGAFALRSSRRVDDPPPSDALPQELSELVEAERNRYAAEIDRLTRNVELWMQRAYEAGWRQQ